MPAGYSGTPTARKLGLRDGHRLALVDAPEAWRVEGIPEGVTVLHGARARDADVVLAFCRNRASVDRRVPALARSLAPDAALWVAWPRRAGGHTSDVTDNGIREVALPLGLVDVKVAALDEDWSGLKVVWRKELREEVAARRARAGARSGGTGPRR